MEALPSADRPAAFWGSDPHPFYNIAKSQGDGSEPNDRANDELIFATETRLGFQLPETVKEFWKVKNGGPVAYCFLDINLPDGSDGEKIALEGLLPLEYVVTANTLSRRITFPLGEIAWSEKISDADKFVVLDAERGKLVLLDYRNGGDPALLLVEDVEKFGLTNAMTFESFDVFTARLRKFQRH